MYFIFVFLIFSVFASSERVPISWNASTIAGYSSDERSYEYPMFAEAAPSPCDLTVGVCDTGCCVDSDCDSYQKKTFNCSIESNRCSRPFSRYDCNCPFDRPFWFSALCYVSENPIYLGAFYRNIPKIEDSKSFAEQTTGWHYKYGSNSKASVYKYYRYGVPVLAHVSENGTFVPVPHPLLHDDDFPSGYSQDCRIPAKYMIDSKHACFVRLTKESCENGLAFGIKSYLIGNSLNSPVVLKNLETEEISESSIILQRSIARNVSKKFGGNIHNYFFLIGNSIQFEFDSGLCRSTWNGTHCNNVLAKAIFHFTTNSTEIIDVNVKFVLTDVIISDGESESDFVFLKKFHEISFSDVNTVKENTLWDDYSFNRGYSIGENLNFGYNRTNGSHFYWEKGHLRIFLNGGVCDGTEDVTFGYDSWARCLHESQSSNCSITRSEVESKFDYLVAGELLAPYSNYRLPHKSAIPVLRDFDSERDYNGTECLIPIRQDIIIQYYTTGFSIQRAIGLVVNRTFSKVGNLNSFTLTTRVVFVGVKPQERKTISRYWERVHSPEMSETAWFNLFNIIDNTAGEKEVEESIFWLFLPIVTSFAVIMLLRDGH